MELKIKIFSLYLLNAILLNRRSLGRPSCQKKEKRKKLYETKPEKYIEDTSFLDGSHDYHCSQPPKNNNHRNRFSHSRTNRNIYRKKKKQELQMFKSVTTKLLKNIETFN